MKKMKQYFTYALTATIICWSLLAGSLVHAKSYSSSKSSYSSKSSWSSSKSSYKPKSSSFNRKSNTTRTYSTRTSKVATNSQSSSFSKTSNVTPKVATKPKTKVNHKVLTPAQRKAKQTKASKVAQKRKASMEKKVASNKRKEVQKALTPKKMTPAQTVSAQKSFRKDPAYSSLSSRPMNRNSYRRDRDNYYNQSNWNPPAYVVNSRSNFGMWDAMFMWMMLDNINKPSYASTYHNNQNSEAYREWRSEANRLSADNADLRRKLNELDSEMKMQTSVPVQGQVGEGIPVAAYASEMAATTPDLSQFKLGVGSKSGMYNKACNILKQADSDNSVNFNCVSKAGTSQILTSIINGELDGGFIQGDILVKYANKLEDLDVLQSTAYEELVFLVTAKDSDIEDIRDFTGNTSNKLYTMGGGARHTMQTFASLDNSYENATKAAVNNKLPMKKDSFKLISKKKNAAVMVVCALNCPLLKELESSTLSTKLKLIPVNDWNFNDKTDKFGNLVYQFKKVSSENYPNLIPKGMFGMKNTEIETMSVEAVFIASNSWLTSKSEDARLMMEFMLENALPTIKEQAGDAI